MFNKPLYLFFYHLLWWDEHVLEDLYQFCLQCSICHTLSHLHDLHNCFLQIYTVLAGLLQKLLLLPWPFSRGSYTVTMALLQRFLYCYMSLPQRFPLGYHGPSPEAPILLPWPFSRSWHVHHTPLTLTCHITPPLVYLCSEYPKSHYALIVFLLGFLCGELETSNQIHLSSLLEFASLRRSLLCVCMSVSTLTCIGRVAISISVAS